MHLPQPQFSGSVSGLRTRDQPRGLGCDLRACGIPSAHHRGRRDPGRRVRSRSTSAPPYGLRDRHPHGRARRLRPQPRPLLHPCAGCGILGCDGFLQVRTQPLKKKFAMELITLILDPPGILMDPTAQASQDPILRNRPSLEAKDPGVRLLGRDPGPPRCGTSGVRTQTS